MKKTLTKIFRSSDSLLKRRKTNLLIFAALFCSTFLSAQFVPIEPSGTKVTITRQTVGSTLPGHVPSPALLEIKSGSLKESFSFSQNKVLGADPKYIYTFPELFSVVGQPPVIRTFKVSFSIPGLASLYYPVPTAIGGSTTIIPGCWTPEMDRGLFYYIGQTGSYGYGVTLTRTASTEYLLQCTKFLCHICDPCPPIIPTVSKSANTNQSKTKIYPNPTSGFSELEYTASGRETITVMVTDIAGKTLYGYKTDIESGVNKLPIDLQKGLPGTYYVNWQSSSGNAGSLPIIKK